MSQIWNRESDSEYGKPTHQRRRARRYALLSGLEGREFSDGRGGRIRSEAVVDHDLCHAVYFQDPYGNVFELDCYDHPAVMRMLVEAQSIIPVRFG